MSLSLSLVLSPTPLSVDIFPTIHNICRRLETLLSWFRRWYHLSQITAHPPWAITKDVIEFHRTHRSQTLNYRLKVSQNAQGSCKAHHFFVAYQSIDGFIWPAVWYATIRYSTLGHTAQLKFDNTSLTKPRGWPWIIGPWSKMLLRTAQFSVNWHCSGH